jgi:hypothetical protein
MKLKFAVTALAALLTLGLTVSSIILTPSRAVAGDEASGSGGDGTGGGSGETGGDGTGGGPGGK